MIVDIHCHYTLTRWPTAVADRFSFEPADAACRQNPDSPARPTDFDSCVSPRALRRWSWRIARRRLRLPRSDDSLDQSLAARYEQHLLAPGPVERFVLLAFDAVHDEEGRVPSLPVHRRDFGSDIYTSNSLIRDLCRRHPDRFLFGASVHPYRVNAPACVEEFFAAGACLLKWLPLHQNIDIGDPRSVAVLRTCATLGLPLLIHYGEEFSLATHRPAFRAAGPLLATLRSLRREGTMPCVIVAHAATPVTPWGDREQYTALLAALTGEFADAPLYADLSALTAPTKVGFLRDLLRRQELHAKLLFATDFPIPAVLHCLRRDLRRDYRRIAGERSWPQRTALAYRRLGFNEIVFQRAAELLPQMGFFRDAQSSSGSEESAGRPLGGRAERLTGG